MRGSFFEQEKKPWFSIFVGFSMFGIFLGCKKLKQASKKLIASSFPHFRWGLTRLIHCLDVGRLSSSSTSYNSAQPATKNATKNAVNRAFQEILVFFWWRGLNEELVDHHRPSTEELQERYYKTKESLVTSNPQQYLTSSPFRHGLF